MTTDTTDTTVNQGSPAYGQGEYRARFAHVDVPAELRPPTMDQFDADMKALRDALGDARRRVQLAGALDIEPLLIYADAAARNEYPAETPEGNQQRADFADGFFRRYFWIGAALGL